MRHPVRALLAGGLTTAMLAVLLPAQAAVADGTDTVEVAATLTTVVVDDPHAQQPEMVTNDLAVVAGRVVNVPDRLTTDLESGQRVTLTVTAPATADQPREVAAALDNGTAHVTAVDAAAAVLTPAVAGAHTLTVLPVYWTGTAAPNTTTLQTTATATANYWVEQTSGAITFTTVDVHPVQSIATPSSCDTTGLMNSALAANSMSAPTARNHVLVYFPELAACPWTGLGNMPGSMMWLNGYTSPDAWEHELGHNLGLGHANAETCTDGGGVPVTLSTTCTTAPYADFADVMGYAQYGDAGNLNAALADYLGTLTPVVATVGQTVTVPRIGSFASPRAVTVALPDGSELYLEYRPSVGRDLRQPAAWAGVQVRLRLAASNQSLILAGTPGPGSGWSLGAAMTPGATWVVPGTSVSVTLQSIGAAGATVRVGDPSAEGVAPVVATPVLRLRTGTTGSTVPATLAVSASDVGSGVCSMSATANGKTVLSGATAHRSVSIAVRPSQSTKVSVTAVDCAGNTTVRSSTWRTRRSAESTAHFTGRWTRVVSSHYLSHHARASGKRHAKATWTFSGTSVAWVGMKRPTGGPAYVVLDGKRVAKVSTRGRTAYRRVLWAGHVRDGVHTVRVVAAKGSHAKVVVDGFASLS